MGVLRKSMASLRIVGDDLDPNEITRLLCCHPTDSQSKGDERTSSEAGRTRVAAFGRWSLAAPEQEPGNLDSQISWIFAATTSNLDVWRAIAARYKLDLFCGLFMNLWNDGASISADSLLALGSRHVQLDLDIYGAIDRELEDSSGS
jgi:hypothetical protein